MGLFTIRNKNISIIINEMGEVENVDARFFIKSYYVRAMLPVFIRLIEHIRGYFPKSWYNQVIEEANACKYSM